MTTDLNDITLHATNDGVSAECLLCGGRASWRSDYGLLVLAEVVAAMRDHLERNHAELRT